MGQELRSGPSWAVLAQGLMKLQPRFQPGCRHLKACLRLGYLLPEHPTQMSGRLVLIFAGGEVRDGAGPLFFSPRRPLRRLLE